MASVSQESSQHGDILLVDFLDSYANLTLKSLRAVDFFLEGTSIAFTHLLKVDDDCFLNLRPLLEVMDGEKNCVK